MTYAYLQPRCCRSRSEFLASNVSGSAYLTSCGSALRAHAMLPDKILGFAHRCTERSRTLWHKPNRVILLHQRWSPYLGENHALRVAGSSPVLFVIAVPHVVYG
ncbi:Uncharacterised protein [Vibrio cholerae]|nr:Uncharacterised protein [Vibrio cholerae]